jgi:exonuclease SbcC
LDNPEALREQFKGIIATNTETIEDLTVERERILSRMQEIARLRMQVNELAALKDDLAKNQEELQAVEESSSGTGPQITTLQATIEQKSQEQQRIQELGAKARSLSDDRVERARLIERKEVALLDLERLRREEQELSQVFSEKELNDAQRSMEQTRLSYEKTSQSHSQLNAAVTEANVRFNTARSAYQRAYDQWDRKKALQEAHATKSLTTDMLDQFRQATVASIAPELSDYATSLISDMTNGDFTEIKLDEEFKASLVDANGVERPVSWLSGGEESAVALALRLSVAFLITGGNPEVLWLDEPLTAQDKDRRSAILSMIRKLPINQILLINHAQEAQDIVDYEVTLTKGD